MPTNLPDQNWTVPAGPDPADAPLGFTDFAGDVVQNVILRYPNTATRDAFNGSRVAGDISFVTGRTWYDRWTGTKWLPCTTISSLKTVNQTVNNSTTFVNATGLVLRYTSSVNADIKFTFTVPAGGNWALGGPVISVAGGGATATPDWEAVNAPASRPSGGAAVPAVVSLVVIVQTGANIGNFQLQFAQNTLEVSNTTLHDFSCITMEGLQ